MYKKIYRLDYVQFFYHDEIDNEDVEIRKIIGFFSSKDKANAARKICNENGKISKNCFQVKEFNICLNYNQKYVYYIFLDYTIIDPKDGQYVDYLQIFPPRSSILKCQLEKETILKTEKYKFINRDEIYISRRKIDNISKEFAYDWAHIKIKDPTILTDIEI